MRIYGPNGSALTAPASNARRTASGTFKVEGEEAPRAAGSATPARVIGGIDTLLALQGVEEPAERRRRAVKRGRSALDVLDELKIGLLDGTLDASMLTRLKSAAAALKDESGDPALDAVLAEIDLRVEVELAKAEVR
jgi:Class II flagellar assembly regulator